MRSAPLPKYQEIAAALRADIVSGVYGPGSRLPSELQLGERFGAAQGTVRRALALLQTEGLVDARHGAGVFVRAVRPILRNASRGQFDPQPERRSIWAADIETRHMDVDRVQVFNASAPERIADALGSDDVWVHERRYLVEGRPVMLAASYLPADILTGPPTALIDEGGTYARLLELGLKPERYREDLRARAPSADEVKALDLRPGTPVVEIARTAFTTGDRAVEVTVMVLDALAYVLQYDFTS